MACVRCIVPFLLVVIFLASPNPSKATDPPSGIARPLPAGENEPRPGSRGTEPDYFQCGVSRATSDDKRSCPSWVYEAMLAEGYEECGGAPFDVHQFYCIRLQSGGYHYMARIECVS